VREEKQQRERERERARGREREREGQKGTPEDNCSPMVTQELIGGAD